MFELPKLDYAYDALEPYIDAKTMEIHHSKHHATYITKLNDAIKGTYLEGQALEDILSTDDIKPAIRNNGGGHFNHSLFWKIIGPKKDTKPSDELAKAIDKSFNSIENFKKEFALAATNRFGSGWAFLLVKGGDELVIQSYANQDNHLIKSENTQDSSKKTAIIGLDVWEHAYYLKYQNRRPEYIEACWNIFNWDVISALYADAKKS